MKSGQTNRNKLSSFMVSFHFNHRGATRVTKDWFDILYLTSPDMRTLNLTLETLEKINTLDIYVLWCIVTKEKVKGSHNYVDFFQRLPDVQGHFCSMSLVLGPARCLQMKIMNYFHNNIVHDAHDVLFCLVYSK